MQLQADATSVRARSAKAAQPATAAATRVVFRPVLDNPLLPQWPNLTPLAATEILQALVRFLEAPPEAVEDRSKHHLIADWRSQEHARRRGRVHGAGSLSKQRVSPTVVLAEVGKKTKRDIIMHPVTTRSAATYLIPTADAEARRLSTKPPPPSPIPKPPVLDYLEIGINEVTRSLEALLHLHLGTTPLPPLSTAPTEEPRRRRKRHNPTGKSRSTLPPILDASKSSAPSASFRFLSQPLLKKTTKLPPRLLPPTESSEFFKEFAEEERKRTERAEQFRSGPGWKKKRFQEFLGEALAYDEPLLNRLRRVEDGVFSMSTKKRKSNDVPPPTEASSAPPAEKSELKALSAVFVCKGDLNPASLVAHLPSMVSTLNGVFRNQKSIHPTSATVYLVPLPIGSEKSLASAMGLRRIACLGVHASAPNLAPLLAAVAKHVVPIESPVTEFIGTHIKHLKTTTPLDPRASNAEKKGRRKRRKEGAQIYEAAD